MDPEGIGVERVSLCLPSIDGRSFALEDCELMMCRCKMCDRWRRWKPDPDQYVMTPSQSQMTIDISIIRTSP
jgi:hypothetical protein